MKSIWQLIMFLLVGVIVGGAAVFAVLKYNPSMRAKLDRAAIVDDIAKHQNDIQDQFDSLFNDDFFGASNPLEEMKKMRQNIEDRLHQRGRSGVGNPFDSWFSNKFGGGTINDIAEREDDKFVYYDIKISDLQSTSVDTKIKDGYITVSGITEKKNDDANEQSVYKSTFSRTFPLPAHVDQGKMEMIPDKDKIVLKFPKLQT